MSEKAEEYRKVRTGRGNQKNVLREYIKKEEEWEQKRYKREWRRRPIFCPFSFGHRRRHRLVPDWKTPEIVAGRHTASGPSLALDPRHYLANRDADERRIAEFWR